MDGAEEDADVRDPLSAQDARVEAENEFFDNGKDQDKENGMDISA